MITSKKIPLSVIILIWLLLANLGCIGWNLSHSRLRASGKEFKIEELHTNEMSGIGIFEAKDEQPLWAEFSQNGKPISEDYYFHGKEVFSIIFSTNRPPKYSVYFRKPDKSITWWLDRGGNGSFTERIFYNTNGDFSRQEIWYDNTWYTVDRENGNKRIFINGQWHQFTFDTEGMWKIKVP